MDAIIMILALDAIALVALIYYMIEDRKGVRKAKQLKAK